MSFHVGQKVVCVDGRGPFNKVYPAGIQPSKGTIYTIAATGLFNGNPHVDVMELPKHCNHACDWRASRFRHAIERSTDAGMAILKKIASDASKTREKVVLD